MELDNTILFTHENCMDGSGCAIIFLAAGGKEENIIFVGANHKASEKKMKKYLLDDRPIIFADCSMSEDMAEQFSIKKNVKLLDHHKTAIPLNRFDWCQVDEKNTMCGSKMLINWLWASNRSKLEKYQELTDHIDDYDRWQHKIPNSKTLAKLHYEVGQWRFIKRFLEYPRPVLYTDEEIIVEVAEEKEADYIEEKLEKTYIKVIDGTRFGIVLADKFQSNLGHRIVEDLEVDIALMVGATTCSMRSGPGVDSSYVAQLNGGGGHPQACGFLTENILGDTLMNIIMKGLKT